jgi:hypothetical protein
VAAWRTPPSSSVSEQAGPALELVLKLAVAFAAFLVLWRIGRAVLAGIARPLPEPPPPGELRKVRLVYRCSVCGTEVRMTTANDEVPDPPRHCMDEMELVTPVE